MDEFRAPGVARRAHKDNTPMYPKLLTLPMGLTITTYGFCLMVGFLSAVWLAMRRAEKIQADPDVILDLAFRALIFGVGGARLMYVIHYWNEQFADRANVLMAVIDIRQGGLEFLGGFLGAAAAITVYLVRRRLSARVYLDILAPGAMWGLAFGRLGCFFNGCCFGVVCPTAVAHDHAHPPWAVEFPYGSLAFVRQWEERKVTVPAELITTQELQPTLVPSSALSMSVEERERKIEDMRVAREAIQEAEDATPEVKRKLNARLRAATSTVVRDGLLQLMAAMKYPSREHPSRTTSPSELEALAAAAHTQPIYATQLFSSIHAMLLSILLSLVFYYRKRQGLVIGLLFLMYPVARVLLELIRGDNPHDVAGLTISQSLSLSMSVGAAVYLVILYKRLPLKSPALLSVRQEDDASAGSNAEARK